ncbi:class E sortase [Blastococcus tunisiensis]|uniref:Sortase A n=1 Tax=Blastococcus tunisiensis TaxID=1798228 RepID=A0A1I2FG31_9ACTN|nr:class E sortase [Blastococcus sp. DSM 46838]SFF04225.1 sortase A [Blastococcus sp. DSM 46838]
MSSAVDFESPPADVRDAAAPRRGDSVRTLLRGVGQTLITIGLVALLFVVYELYVTDLLAAREQDRLSEQIQEQWADLPPADAPTVAPPAGSATPGADPAPPAPESIQVGLGDPVAVLHIPRLGADYERVVVEGTAQVQLAQGPGHYLDTAMPGQEGNFAVAGHRVGRGSPFLDLDRMRPGDAVVVETASTWYVYRVLGDPATGDFGADPSGIPGRAVVDPAAVDVIAAVPGRATAGPTEGAYLTLTTCHPKYSAAQRLVVHARLDGAPVSKAAAPDGPPALAG